MNVVAICFFCLGMVALLVKIYVAIRYLDEIEGLLSKSSAIKKQFCIGE